MKRKIRKITHGIRKWIPNQNFHKIYPQNSQNERYFQTNSTFSAKIYRKLNFSKSQYVKHFPLLVLFNIENYQSLFCSQQLYKVQGNFGNWRKGFQVNKTFCICTQIGLKLRNNQWKFSSWRKRLKFEDFKKNLKF